CPSPRRDGADRFLARSRGKAASHIPAGPRLRRLKLRQSWWHRSAGSAAPRDLRIAPAAARRWRIARSAGPRLRTQRSAAPISFECYLWVGNLVHAALIELSMDELSMNDYSII